MLTFIYLFACFFFNTLFKVILYFVQLSYVLLISFISDVPVCDETQDVVYGVSENESVSVHCRVNSYPPADAFTWSFDNSLTFTLLPTSTFTFSPGHSVIRYTPHTHMDFGTLLCWGTNMVGNQKTNKPCVFHIIPTGILKAKLKT